MIPEQRLAGVKSTVERAERPTLICHVKPDGDAIGSMLGLGSALQGQGKDVRYVCKDPVPGHYRFLRDSEAVMTEPQEDTDLFILVDCPDDRKSGFDVPALASHAPVVDIDHHPKPVRPQGPRLAMYDTDASSAAEMVFELCRFSRWRLDRHAATALLTGIVFDTSAFQNNNTSARTLEVTGRLLKLGGRHKDVIKHCFYTSTIPKLRLWGTAMARIEQNPEIAGIVSTVVTAEDIAETGAHPDDLEGLVNFLNAIPGVPAMLLLTDLHDGEVKGSLRTRNDRIKVNKLARMFGGGGHPQAAGFSIPGRLVKNPDDTWQVAPPDGVPRNPRSPVS